jgi:hypothetical protein
VNSIPVLSSFLDSLLQLNMVLAFPTKSFTDTAVFVVRIGREASTHALIFVKGIKKQRNTQGHVIGGLARVDFSPFPLL